MSINANHSGFSAEAIYNQAIQYGTSGNAQGFEEYVGFAAPGAATSEAKWLVKKLTYDSDGNVILVQVAVNSAGDGTFSNIFDNPENLDYA